MIFSFDRFELDEERWELRGPQGPVDIEPRVLSTLLHLLRHRDQVVSKQELVDAVWSGEHVTDGAVAQAVARARRALGVDGTRSIRTVHGRGYRFVRPVIEEPSRRAEGARTRTVRSLLVAAAVVVAALSAVAFRLSENANRRVESPPVFLELEVDASGSEPGAPFLARSFREALGRSLGAMDRVSLVPRSDAEETATHRVTVRIAPGQTPGFARLDATLRELLPGREPIALARHEIPYLQDSGDLTRFVAVREAVTARIAAKLERTIHQEAGAVPKDLEAWRLYLDALNQWEVGCGVSRASGLLERSVALDDRFAPAWFLLGGARFTAASFCAPRSGLLASALSAVERAERLAPEAAEPRQLEAAIRLQSGETERAFALLVETHSRRPENLEALVRLSEALRYTGQLDLSEQVLESVLARQPASSVLADWVPYPYLYRGDWQRFLALLSGRSSPYFRYYRGFVQSMSGDRASAVATLEPAFLQHPDDLFARLSQALLATLEDRPVEAQVVLEQLIRQRAAQELRDGEVTYKIAQLLVLADAPDSGIDQLASAVDQGFFCVACIEQDPILRRLAGNAAFESVVDAAETRQRAFASRFRHELLALEAGETRLTNET